MNEKDFYKCLKGLCTLSDKCLKSLSTLSDKIVYMRFKYSWEKDWTYSKEILYVDMSSDDYYVWLNDWDEGQQEVEILGCMSIDDVDVPLFNNGMKGKEK